VLIVNQLPVVWLGKQYGTVTTLRDRTELEALTGELDTTKAFAESLRSQAHETANRLHTMVVLIETGRSDEAIRYATGQLGLTQQLTDSIVTAVAEPVLAALLLGKTAHPRGRRAAYAERRAGGVRSRGRRSVRHLSGHRPALPRTPDAVGRAHPCATAWWKRLAGDRVRLANEPGLEEALR
jgi:hypothetical protein